MARRLDLRRLDRRVIFLFIFAAVIWPLVAPIRLPMDVTPPVQQLYETVEALPAGSIVMLAADYSPDMMPELQPMVVAFVRHAFRRNLRIVAASLWPDSPPLVEAAVTPLIREFEKKYGVDFVNLGYMAGDTVTLLGMGTSIPNTFPRDYYQTAVSDIPLMHEVENFSSIALVMNISAGTPGTREWVQQVQGRFNVRLASGTTAVAAPPFYPYIQSGQLVGLLGGLKGAAEYETLIGVPADGTKGMDAQSVVHALVVFFILLGNVLFLVDRRRTRRTAGQTA